MTGPVQIPSPENGDCPLCQWHELSQYLNAPVPQPHGLRFQTVRHNRCCEKLGEAKGPSTRIAGAAADCAPDKQHPFRPAQARSGSGRCPRSARPAGFRPVQYALMRSVPHQEAQQRCPTKHQTNAATACGTEDTRLCLKKKLHCRLSSRVWTQVEVFQKIPAEFSFSGLRTADCNVPSFRQHRPFSADSTDLGFTFC